MKLKPLSGYVIIQPISEEETTSSGLLVAQTNKDRPVKGKILAVGGSLKDEICPVDVDDVVAYRKWSGDEIKVGEKEYRVVKFGDVIAKFV